MIEPTEMTCRPLTSEEFEAVAGGSETITATFKYGDLAVEVWADKDRYGVCTSVSSKPGKSCVVVK